MMQKGAIPDQKQGFGQEGDEFFGLLSETFKALGDASRIKIIWELSSGECCVGSLCEKLRMSQPAVSHHLRTLRNLRLAKVRKDGATAYYSLDDHHIGLLLQEGSEHVRDLMGEK